MGGKAPVTSAVRMLRLNQVEFSDHLYEYQEHGGTAHSAHELGLAEHCIIKTLVMEDESKNPWLVLMHGDCEVSTKALARTLGVKTITPCNPAIANKHTGYQVGGISPFNTRKPLPVIAEQSIFTLPRVYINGGKRGYLIGIDATDLQRLLQPKLVQVAIVD
ncbi:MAG: aminoacyl-tRNA deacylase [Candidatus Competibacteraceae bacterium]|nr:aminoacyl-tRNA deacylase [Candidatus Competibacteraceae bacterium]